MNKTSELLRTRKVFGIAYLKKHIQYSIFTDAKKLIFKRDGLAYQEQKS